MRYKRVIAVSAATVLFMSMTLNVSAAKSSTDRYISRLKKSKQVSLILDVDAYRAAYSDLEEAFGNNRDAYIKHYLTAGVYEGRTKGVLFDPLTYVEGYDDIKEAFGDDILAIVNHYVTYGVKENRTIGTAVGYEDMAAAIEDGAVQIADRGESSSALSGSRTEDRFGGTRIGHTTSIYDKDNKLIRVEYYDENNKLIYYSDVINYDSQTKSYTENVYTYDEKNNSHVLVRTDTYVNGVLSTGTSGNQTSTGTSGSQTSTGTSGGQTSTGTSGGQTSSGTSGNQTEDRFGGTRIGHTTSIYDSDNKLIRIEYYDENNKLIYYSEVTDYNSETKSYTETVYSSNDENDAPVRTDTYVNGELSSKK